MKRLHNAIRQKLMLLFLMGVFPFSIYGQDDKVAEVTSTYAITNVNIIQAPGRKIDLGTVLIEDGIIKAVGKSVTIPASAKVIKADSMYLYAGFIDGLSQVAVEKPKDKEREDVKDPGNPPNELAGIQPERNVRDFLKADDKSVDDWRKMGFTAAHVVPDGRMLPGSDGPILLTGTNPDEMIYSNQVSLFSQLRGAPGVYPNTVIGVMAKYRDLYRNAENAKSYKQRYDQDGVGMERPNSDRILEAFYPVIDKSIPVAFKAESVLDVQRVLTLKNDLGFNLILGEVKQGWDITDKIKAANAKVFLSLDLPEWEEKKDTVANDSVKAEPKTLSGAEKEQERLEKRKEEMIMKYYEQPALFRDQGITFGFSTLEAKSGDIKSNINKLVEKGLNEDVALAALTTSPAQLLGLSKTMGTIDQGKLANLFISDKPYFEKESNVKMVFVDGKLYEYENKPKKKKNGDEEDVDPKGDWTYSTETPQGNGSGTVKFEGGPGNYSGQLTSSFSSDTNTLSDITVDGSQVSFSFTIAVGGDALNVSVSITVDGDTFEGTMTAGSYGSFPIEGERTPKN
ncbi:amidohydrolase family protein [Fulvivirga aurantia]|uniref:amidohydrolase family protein n=1 Tax=Fulvivirga aurantia TaxID=2529383 RepID=UPI0016292632|nr:amidohydrolase family protein [Fulvivirga aurantia]